MKIDSKDFMPPAAKPETATKIELNLAQQMPLFEAFSNIQKPILYKIQSLDPVRDIHNSQYSSHNECQSYIHGFCE